MLNYRPFEQPYGIATKTGVVERLKGLLTLVLGSVGYVVATGAFVLANATPTFILSILSYTIGGSLFLVSLLYVILGIIWAYFPQWKPELRKRLLW